MFSQVSLILYKGRGKVYTPQADTTPRADSPQADTPLPETATAAAGTHPTGMRSCLKLV